MNVDFSILRELAKEIPDDVTEDRKMAAAIEFLALMGIEMTAEVIALGILYGVLEAEYHNGILDEFLDSED